MRALVTELQAAGPRLTQTVLEQMYRNPFWEEHFGERGRKRANEDGGFHISYLVQALSLRDAGVMTRYAQWLQSVLTSRGMCSLHLADNFRKLGQAILQEALEGGEEAAEYLRLAEAALDTATETHRVFGRARERLAQDAVLALEEQGGSPAVDARRDRARCVDDARYHLSYLADALASKRPELFVSYCQWVAPFLERRAVPREALTALLRSLGEELAAEPALPEELRREALEMLSAGLVSLGAPGLRTT